VGAVAGPAHRLLEEGLHFVGRMPECRKPRPIADCFQFSSPVGVELLVAEGFSVGGLVPDPESGVAPQLLLRRKATWSLHDCVEQVSPDRPDAGHFLKLFDLRILAPEPPHLGLRLGLRFEGNIQHPVEAPKLLCDLGALEAVEIVLPPLLGIDPLPLNIQDAPAAEGCLDR